MRDRLKAFGVGLAGLLACTPAHAGLDDDEVALVSLLIKRSEVTVEKAFVRALEAHPGVIFEYELEEESDRFVHEVEIVNPDESRKYKVEVDAETGNISGDFSTDYESIKEDSEARAGVLIAKHEFGVLDAIKLVRGSVEGLVTEVELKERQGIVYFEVEIFTAEGEQTVLVDLMDGSIIPMVVN